VGQHRDGREAHIKAGPQGGSVSLPLFSSDGVQPEDHRGSTVPFQHPPEAARLLRFSPCVAVRHGGHARRVQQARVDTEPAVRGPGGGPPKQQGTGPCIRPAIRGTRTPARPAATPRQPGSRRPRHRIPPRWRGRLTSWIGQPAGASSRYWAQRDPGGKRMLVPRWHGRWGDRAAMALQADHHPNVRRAGPLGRSTRRMRQCSVRSLTRGHGSSPLGRGLIDSGEPARTCESRTGQGLIVFPVHLEGTRCLRRC
jgi:hypothetical protein